jgi:hypothetical protein
MKSATPPQRVFSAPRKLVASAGNTGEEQGDRADISMSLDLTLREPSPLDGYS